MVRSGRRSGRVDVGRLAERVGLSCGELRDALGVSEDRWRVTVRRGASLEEADEWACWFGLWAGTVWAEEWCGGGEVVIGTGELRRDEPAVVLVMADWGWGTGG